VRPLALAAAVALAGCSGSDCKVACASGTTLTVCTTAGAKTISCKGPMGCSAGVCDTSTATLGDDCDVNGALRCDPDTAQQVLLCEQYKLSKYRTCSGPRTCYTDPSFDAGTIGCDFTSGDVCPASYEGHYACDSVDHTEVLRCTDGGAVYYEQCMSGTCQQDGGVLVCQ